jgi:hypothetical protein
MCALGAVSKIQVPQQISLETLASFHKFFQRLYTQCVSTTPQIDKHTLVDIPNELYSVLRALGFCTFVDKDGKEHTVRDSHGYPICNNWWEAFQTKRQEYHKSRHTHHTKNSECIDKALKASRAATQECEKNARIETTSPRSTQLIPASDRRLVTTEQTKGHTKKKESKPQPRRTTYVHPVYVSKKEFIKEPAKHDELFESANSTL